MPYDPSTAERVRRLLTERGLEISEKRIVGGSLGIMVDGHLCCGVRKDGLSLRVGPEGLARALAAEHTEPLQLGSRQTKSFVVVSPEGYRTEEALAVWLEKSLQFIATLRPSKK